ncbi:MAG: hypothetical protein R3F47_18230 [Gammaproteobacteria bacterium]
MKTCLRIIAVTMLAIHLGGCALADYMCNDMHWNPGGLGDATFWFC